MSKKAWVQAIAAAVAVVVIVVGLGVGLGVGLTWRSGRADRVGAPCEPYGPPVGSGGRYSYAAVATDVGKCSEIGSDMLEKGGSAVDAAIASLLCIGLTNPHSSGIGGGLFMTIYDRVTRTAETINARDMAPAAATENMYQRNFTLSTLGGLAVAVPGEIRAFWTAHQKHGKLPWRDLFQPAIQLAEEGVCIGGALAAAIDEKTVDIKRPWSGGIITEQDLRDYRVEVTSPLNISLAGGLTVLSPPPPASGPVLSLILNILDGYRFSPSSVDSVDNQVLTYHRIIEAFKFAYAKRSELGDPNFVDIAELIRNMTSDDYAESLRLRITDSTTHDYRYYGPSFVLPEDGGTSHVSVLAPNGDAVSVTSTVNLFFGSKLRSASTGVILNNLMDDFSSPNLTNSFGVPPSPANFIRPGKRPMSSMNPTVVVDGNGDVRLVTGASGGTKITTATAYVLMQHLWFGLDLGPAVEKPRLHHQLLPDRVDTERSRPFQPEAVLEGLRQKNHVTNVAGSAIVNGVARNGDVISAACDSLKGGFPVGF
ncbi:PREDICTED: gamma-glutamyltranspeptidase 1-like [Branchiostoma belcheri]|uniref:Gamma-glutamyltranspeptidase 1-like n=1 Tax=Branchiostoma belcheri TaxID=7741 RepID=A0A6P4ZBD7_BRABE|nr:PREDICTED: gamma-glutamyltranspeptidase 1-like [Branchiostoma belcheri]